MERLDGYFKLSRVDILIKIGDVRDAGLRLPVKQRPCLLAALSFAQTMGTFREGDQFPADGGPARLAEGFVVFEAKFAREPGERCR